MPVLHGSITFSRFYVDLDKEASTDWKRSLPRGLRSGAFQPIDRKSEETRSAGYVEIENNQGVEFSVGSIFSGEDALFAFRVDSLKVPAAALKKELAKWEQAFIKENERKPSRAEKAQNRASILQLLLQRTDPVTKVYDVSWNLKSHELRIWASSRTVVEEVVVALEESFKLKLESKVPASAARRSGIDEASLKPTPELVGDLDQMEAINDAA